MEIYHGIHGREDRNSPLQKGSIARCSVRRLYAFFLDTKYFYTIFGFRGF